MENLEAQNVADIKDLDATWKTSQELYKVETVREV